jgi:hypothetical protein
MSSAFFPTGLDTSAVGVEHCFNATINVDQCHEAHLLIGFLLRARGISASFIFRDIPSSSR